MVINYNSSANAAEEVASDIRRTHGVRSIVIKADISDDQDVIRLFDEAKDKLGRIDVVMVHIATHTSFSNGYLSSVSRAMQVLSISGTWRVYPAPRSTTSFLSMSRASSLSPSKPRVIWKMVDVSSS